MLIVTGYSILTTIFWNATPYNNMEDGYKHFK